MSIVDQGYQHWSGHLSSHAWRWLAITRQGIRTGLKIRGVRRTLFIAWMPALGLVAFLCVWGLLERKSDIVGPLLPALRILGDQGIADPRHFRVAIWTIAYSQFLTVELWFSMILILRIGPNLISQDLRFNALPLYFSRPLRRIDYFLGKLGVIGAFIAMVMIAPALIAYVLGLAFSLDITILRDTLPILFATILYGGVIVVSAGLFMLALSSLSRNSRNIAILWFVIWLLTSFVSALLVKIDHDERVRARAAREQLDQPFRSPRDFDWRQNRDRIEVEVLQDTQRDWRPLISYTGNLRRIGEKLLGSNACWESLAKVQLPERQDGMRVKFIEPEYPWYWSAGVLMALGGVCAGILSFRIKSLDRLK